MANQKLPWATSEEFVFGVPEIHQHAVAPDQQTQFAHSEKPSAKNPRRPIHANSKRYPGKFMHMGGRDDRYLCLPFGGAFGISYFHGSYLVAGLVRTSKPPHTSGLPYLCWRSDETWPVGDGPTHQPWQGCSRLVLRLCGADMHG